MTEKLLQFIWKHQLFDKSNLKTRDNESIQIIFQGIHNQNSGPDFSEAELFLENVKWIGNIEIHNKESDWRNHNHHLDKNYENIILHVIFKEDQIIETNCPILCIEPYINKNLIEKHAKLFEIEKWIPCEDDISKVNSLYVKSFLDKLLVDRLEYKTNLIVEEGKINNDHWIEITNHIIFKNFGCKLNNDIFSLLARSIPYKVIEQNNANLFRMEALLFGQAGLLDDDFEDEYPILLKNEYQYLRERYQLTPISGHLWKFMRTRPSNFPTIRISQLASFLNNIDSNFIEKICENELNWVHQILNSTKASYYWETHYHFDKTSKKRNSGKLGSDTTRTFIINAVVQLIFAFGKHTGNETLIEKALAILGKQKAEENNIIAGWSRLNIKPENAADSQALLELKKFFCQNMRCLECGIGFQILNQHR